MAKNFYDSDKMIRHTFGKNGRLFQCKKCGDTKIVYGDITKLKCNCGCEEFEEIKGREVITK